jgi:Spy/CpxP family protein refolding chaperone
MKTPQIYTTIAAATTVLLVFATPLLPQGKQQPSLDKRMQTITKDLSLTSDQVTKVRPILETQEKEMQTIRQVNKGNLSARKKEVKAREATEAQFNLQADKINHDAMQTAISARDSTFKKEMAAVLTAEQNTKFLEEQTRKETYTTKRKK